MNGGDDIHDRREVLLEYHRRTRRRGVRVPVYWAVRAVLQPLILVYFRLGRLGREHVPDRGAVILAANHRSFLDPFAIAFLTRRPVYFVAKQELFAHRLVGWLLNAVGAFPVRRGESDEETMATARELLARGEAIVIFPEGTRVRSGALGEPRRGVGRMALESGAPVVPVAVVGSEAARRGWRIRPCRVRLRCGRPLTFPQVSSPSPKLAAEVTARIWPCVELQWEWLGGLPPLRTAAVVGGGPMGLALAALLARAGLSVQVGCRTAAQAEALRTTDAGGSMPASRRAALEAGVRIATVPEIEFAGVDLVVFAVPSRSLPAAVGESGAQIGQRSAVLVASKGLVAPLGTLPSRYVGDRVRARAVASFAGPAHADEAVETGAAVVLATGDEAFGSQLAGVLGRAGLSVERTEDVIGAELAGCAKNVAALAAAAAGSARGPNAAGAEAARVFEEVHDHALRAGARSRTFIGLAGTGDLVGTVLAEGSRNRRAGTLLAQGVPASQIGPLLGATPEALDIAPLLTEALKRAGSPHRATSALAALVEGGVTVEEWLAAPDPGLRRAA